MVLLRKLVLGLENIGTPNIHEFIEKLDKAQVVGEVADIVKDRNNDMIVEEEWSDDDS